MVNGLSKNARLAKFKPNSRGLVVSYFYEEPSRSLDFVFNAKEVSGSQKMYQSRRLAKSRIYHSTPLLLPKRDITYLHSTVFHLTALQTKCSLFTEKKNRLMLATLLRAPQAVVKDMVVNAVFDYS